MNLSGEGEHKKAIYTQTIRPLPVLSNFKDES